MAPLVVSFSGLVIGVLRVVRLLDEPDEVSMPDVVVSVDDVPVHDVPLDDVLVDDVLVDDVPVDDVPLDGLDALPAFAFSRRLLLRFIGDG